MTMNYQSVTNKRKTHKRVLLGSGVFLVLIVVIVAAPSVFGVFAQWIGISSWWEESVAAALTSRKELVEENQSLRALVARAETTQELASFYQGQYQEMYQHYTGLDESVVTGAEVLLRPPYSAYDYLVLNAGSLDGVVRDQFVVAEGQYVVGYIDAVTPGYSRVALFSAPREEVLVSVEGNLYPARGQGGGVSYIRLPRSFTDSTEQVVRMPGAGPYTMGLLETASFRPQDSYVTGVLTMPVNLFALERVSVVALEYTNQAQLEEEFDEIELEN